LYLLCLSPKNPKFLTQSSRMDWSLALATSVRSTFWEPTQAPSGKYAWSIWRLHRRTRPRNESSRPREQKDLGNQPVWVNTGQLLRPDTKRTCSNHFASNARTATLTTEDAVYLQPERELLQEAMEDRNDLRCAGGAPINEVSVPRLALRMSRPVVDVSLGPLP